MITVSIDTTKFAEQLREYMDYTKKDLADVVNQKAFFIALKARDFTPAADPDAIRRQLLTPVLAFRRGQEARRKKGARKPVRVKLIYLIIQARRARAGESGYYGDDMRRAVQGVLGGRRSAAGFEKAGWVWAMRDLAPYVPSAMRYARRHNLRVGSTPVGRADPARESLDPSALILNRAWPRRQHDRAGALRLQTRMGNALQLAFDEEGRSMMDYVNDKMTERIVKQGLGP